MAWHNRLLRRIKELGWSKAELARRAGLDKDRVYKWLRGGVDNPRGDVLEQLAAAVGWTEHFLLYGVELGQSVTRPSNHTEEPSMRLPLYNWGELEVLSLRGQKPLFSGTQTMPKPDDDVGPDAFYTTAPDNSNAPEIKKGDRLLCDPSLEPIPDSFVIASVNGHPEPILARYHIRQFRRGKATQVDLVRENKAYGVIRVARMTDVRILGRVTHHTRRL